MKITIDPQLCEKTGLSLSQLLLLMSVRLADLNENIHKLLDLQAIVRKDNQYLITQHWNDVVDEILADSMATTDNEDYLKELAKSLAKTFPQGKMPGTAFYYRCNNKEIALKLKKFFVNHPEYKPTPQTAERIIKAAERYNKEMDLNPHYRVLAKYFISKVKTIQDEDGLGHNEEQSLLATYLENEGQEAENTDSWLLTSRN